MKKIITALILTFIMLVMSSCTITPPEKYPAITNTSFKIVINEEYEIIQTSASTCNFVKDAQIAQMKIIVERVDTLNWNKKYVILKDLEEKYYIYEIDTSKLDKTDDYKIFRKLKEVKGIDLELKSKDEFEKQAP
ncbi:hypothetical protein [Candidatus Enterococcus ikei]|uniref:Lipoprotein n=1 Tax=Candidatus Enterococcus ikei TaxID=2815326 RepID=A0ABS3GZI1_9ENTE|nr:hypothetical protein [Enterococcus sp. DIV0869a]MBO0440668.1 hypothetical protein [Enterococcus sp. DIV0869a]